MRKIVIFLWVAFFTLTSNAQSWKQIGISNPADIYEPNPGDLFPYGIGIVWSLKFEPEYDGAKKSRLFATGVSSGLWVSPTGKGNDWKLLNTDFLPETSIGDFAIHPHNRNKIIIGTGLPKIRQSRNKDLFGLPRGRGIFTGTISKKNTVKWQLIPDQNFHENDIVKDNSTFWNNRIKCVGSLVYTTDAKALILAVIEEETPVKYNTYIYKSVNGGTDWYLKATLNNLFLHDLDLNPDDPNNIIVCCSYDGNVNGHIFETHDQGESWNPIFSENNDLNMEGFYRASFDNNKPAKLWICKTTSYSNDIYIQTIPSELMLFRKYRQWHNAGGCSAFDISSYGNDFFSVASVSLNCIMGDKFQNLTMEMHSDIRSVAYIPKTKDMMVANDGGVTLVFFDSISQTYKAKDVSIGLEMGRITNVSGISQNNYGFANWDNSCRWVHPKLNGYKFFDLFGNESSIFEMNDSAILDGSAGPTNAILYTFDSNYTLFQREIFYGDFFTFVPKQKKFFYIYGTQLHRVDYIVKPAADNIVYTHPQGDKYFLQPKVAPNNPEVIYTATQQQGAYYHFQIFKSEDGGSNWVEYNTQPFGGSLTDLAIDPNNSDKICVGSRLGEVFFSDNSGLSFKNSFMPIEAGAINTLTYIDSKWVLAACDYGLWIYNINFFGEGVWRKFNGMLSRKATKLPDCRITDIEYMPESKTIRAATMGRGVFECDVKKIF